MTDNDAETGHSAKAWNRRVLPATVAPDSTPPAVTDDEVNGIVEVVMHEPSEDRTFTKSPDYLRGERAGLELAAYKANEIARDGYGDVYRTGVRIADEIRALLPPSTPDKEH